MTSRFRFAASACLAAAALGAAAPTAHAFTQETHRRIVLDAVHFMRANPGLTNYGKLAQGATRAGYTIDEFAQTLAQAAYDVDSFSDTYLCGAITGDCVKAPLWGLGTSIARYTSFWHFEDHAHGADVHGNPHGGYNYSRIAIKGDIDELAAGWLWNDYLDDGAGGMKGLFGDTSRYNSYGLTEAHYRLGGHSTPSMYADYQKFPFHPISNLGQYWFSQFLARPTAQTLGFVLHTADLAVPQHTWNTLANHHSGFEGWVQNYYDSEQLGAFWRVQAALGRVGPLAPQATDLRPMLREAGEYSYAQGALVLSSTAHADRLAVAHKLVPHAIALVVRVLGRAAERMVQ
ncbi:MAG: phospholipase [Pseudomonadota bacterium]